MSKKRLLAGQLIEMQIKIIRIVEFIGLPRSSFYYKSCYDKEKDKELTEKIKEIAYKYSFYGYRRVYRAVRENGFMVNHKKVYRIYKSLSLQKVVKKRRKFILCDFPFSAAEKKNSVWATDFISDSLGNGRKFRIMVVEDIYSRMVVVCLIAESIRSSAVVKVLEEAIAVYGKPQSLRSDNGPEYISRSLGAFLSQERITHERIEKGKPAQNGYAETFMARLREECLNRHVFKNMEEAKSIVGEYIKWYNNERQHSGIGYKTPVEMFG